MARKNKQLVLFSIFILLSIVYVKAQSSDSAKSVHAIYSTDFSKDALGKFPQNWVSNRPGEIVIQKNLLGKWLKMHAQGTYLPKLDKELPKNFTISFDFIHQAIGNGNNTTEITLFSKSDSVVNDALFPGSRGVKIILETFIVSCLCYDNQNQANKPSAEYRSKIIQANHLAKVSIKVEGQLLSVSVNGFECIRIPVCLSDKQAINAMRFYLWGSQAEPLISNLKIYQ